MPKGRIGLSLEIDVMAVLAQYGRCEFRESLVLGDCVTCGQPHSDERHGLKRPTRTEITQTAIREWAARQNDTDPQASSSADSRKPASLGVVRGLSQVSEIEPPSSLSPEAKAARAMKRTEIGERKTKLRDEVTRAFPSVVAAVRRPKTEIEEARDVAIIVGSTRCPHKTVWRLCKWKACRDADPHATVSHIT